MNTAEVREKIRSAPSFPKLRKAYAGFLTSLYGKDSGYVHTRMEQEDAEPERLLTAHASVMDAKSARCKTMKQLANDVFRETGLPRNAQGKYRGMDGVNWQALGIRDDENNLIETA